MHVPTKSERKYNTYRNIDNSRQCMSNVYVKINIVKLVHKHSMCGKIANSSLFGVSKLLFLQRLGSNGNQQRE